MVSKKNIAKKKAKADIPLFIGLLVGFSIVFAYFSYIYSIQSPIQATNLSANQQIGHMVIVSNSPIPAGIVAYVPIYLNNPSNTTTAPTIFINISRNKYLPYLAYNESESINKSFGKWWKIAPNQQLNNLLEFYYELDNSSYPSGWMGMFFYEKLNYAILMSNSSTIIAMVQLPSSVAPNSNMTIYMGFKSD